MRIKGPQCVQWPKLFSAVHHAFYQLHDMFMEKIKHHVRLWKLMLFEVVDSTRDITCNQSVIVLPMQIYSAKKHMYTYLDYQVVKPQQGRIPHKSWIVLSTISLCVAADLQY